MYGYGRISPKELLKYGEFIDSWLNPEGEFDERPGRNVPVRRNIRPTEAGYMGAQEKAASREAAFLVVFPRVPIEFVTSK